MKKKKKKIYSKEKRPILYVKKKPENVMQFASYWYGKHNYWSEFIDRVIFKKENIEMPQEHHLGVIFRKITSKVLKKQVINLLMAYKDYNPFINEIPLDAFPDNIRKHIAKIQQEIVDTREEAQKVIINTAKLRVKEKEYTIGRFIEPEKNINSHLFYQKYDILIIYKEGKVTFVSNPETSNRIDLSDLYHKLNECEPNIWFLHGNKGILKTKRGTISKFPNKQLYLMLKKVLMK